MQIILLFGCFGTGKSTQGKMLHDMIIQEGRICQVFDVDDYPQRSSIHNGLKIVDQIMGSTFDFFIVNEISENFEEMKLTVNLLSKMPDTNISAVLIEIPHEEIRNHLSQQGGFFDISRSLSKSLVYTEESWRYLCTKCPNVGVYRVLGIGTKEEVHERMAKCVTLISEAKTVSDSPHQHHD